MHIESQAPSKGVAMLLAANSAMPRSIGDRQRSAAMNDLTGIAIDCKVGFDLGDGDLLAKAQIGIHTCVGVYDPLSRHFYDQAARAGGTYARMWERHAGVKPFIAKQSWHGSQTPRTDARMAPRVAILLPLPEDDNQSFERAAGAAMWICTSVDYEKDVVVLCRYRGAEHHLPRTDALRDPQPAKRRIVTRAQWDRFNDEIALV